MLTNLGMVPANNDHVVAICIPSEKQNKTVLIYPYGFRFRTALMTSQHMVLASGEPHTDACQLFSVYTHYNLPKPDELFWETIASLPGDYYLYINQHQDEEVYTQILDTDIQDLDAASIEHVNDAIAAGSFPF